MAARHQVIPISAEPDVIRALAATRDLARAAGLAPGECAAMTTAVSELARNVVKYAERGRVELSVVNQGGRQGLQAVVVDQGPGIDSIDLALRDHYSTSNTLGLGLPGTRRLVDDFEIDSAPGRGTRVVVRKWNQASGPGRSKS